MKTGSLIVRDAQLSDRDALVSFNCSLALETEGKQLDPSVVGRGVERALTTEDRLRYWVAEREGKLLGQSAISREWSDWRCGWIWWLQSVYVVSEARGFGVFRALHSHIRETAHQTDEVIGLRLYVEQENHRAQKTYEALGMLPGGYVVFEELWPDRYGRSESVSEPTRHPFTSRGGSA
ncbi:GNAT family N-acetyltransferase [Tautonia rosea]|uniref:GNAT family N-acetyltransferase n=1 Tax=Tautonia rosea TaxID=2728037 RepID=UPI001475E859|nr:GNAT family N-acetyltransferase [Tautonia rosea]